MTRNISWINEIYNNTNTDYIMWVWDTDNEGDFSDFRTGQSIGKNDGGRRVIIKAGAHLRVTGCGVPDGGDKDGKNKCRVLCEVAKAVDQNPKLDPGRGLRLNRVMAENERDKLVYRDHGTGREIASISFPRGLEQNLVLRIEKNGIFLDVREQKESTEWKATVFGRELGKALAEMLQEVAKLALQAAATALA